MAWKTAKEPRENFITLRMNDTEAGALAYVRTKRGAKNDSEVIRALIKEDEARERKRDAKRKGVK